MNSILSIVCILLLAFQASFVIGGPSSCQQIGNAQPHLILGESYTFPVLSGLVARYESTSGLSISSGVVDQWNDLSGQGNHLSSSGGNRPSLSNTPNGKRAVSFDGISDVLSRNVSAGINGLPIGSADRTMYVVTRYKSGGWGSFTYGTPACGQSFGLSISPSREPAVQGWCGGYDYTQTTIPTTFEWNVHSTVFQSGNVKMYWSGVQTLSFTPSYSTVMSSIVMGAELDFTPFVNMDVAAALIFNRALNEDERVLVENYLQRVYIHAGTAYAEASSLSHSPSLMVRFGSTTTDASGNGKVFNSVGNVRTNVPGPSPAMVAAEFGGSANDYVLESAASADLSVFSAFSIEAWVYPAWTTTTGARYEIMTRNPWYFNIQNNTLCIFIAPSIGYVCSATTVPRRGWSHVAAIWQGVGGTLRLYINGVGSTSVTVNSINSTLTVSSQISVGICAVCGFGAPFVGMISNPAVYSYALSEAVLQRHASLYETRAMDFNGAASSFNAECDFRPDASGYRGWTKVFRQTTNPDRGGGLLAAATVTSLSTSTLNPSTPSGTAYSILNHLEQFRGNTGRFMFQFRWADGGITQYPNLSPQIWSQTSNPATTAAGSAPTGYQAINISYTSMYWGGLQRSSTTNVFMDGTLMNDWWWYSVGVGDTSWGTTLPGPNETTVYTTELWARIECNNNTKPQLIAAASSINANNELVLTISSSLQYDTTEIAFVNQASYTCGNTALSTYWSYSTVSGNPCGLNFTSAIPFNFALQRCGFTVTEGSTSTAFDAIVRVTTTQYLGIKRGVSITDRKETLISVQVLFDISVSTVSSNMQVYGPRITYSAIQTQTGDLTTSPPTFYVNFLTSVQWPYQLHTGAMVSVAGFTASVAPITSEASPTRAVCQSLAVGQPCLQLWRVTLQRTTACPTVNNINNNGWQVNFGVMCHTTFNGSCSTPSPNTDYITFNTASDDYCPRLIDTESSSASLIAYSNSSYGNVPGKSPQSTFVFGATTYFEVIVTSSIAVQYLVLERITITSGAVGGSSLVVYSNNSPLQRCNYGTSCPTGNFGTFNNTVTQLRVYDTASTASNGAAANCAARFSWVWSSQLSAATGDDSMTTTVMATIRIRYANQSTVAESRNIKLSAMSTRHQELILAGDSATDTYTTLTIEGASNDNNNNNNDPIVNNNNNNASTSSIATTSFAILAIGCCFLLMGMLSVGWFLVRGNKRFTQNKSMDQHAQQQSVEEGDIQLVSRN